MPTESIEHHTPQVTSNGAQQTKAAKLNGLKNRQRPPPLILDKVSHYNYINSSSNVEQPARVELRAPAISNNNRQQQASSTINGTISCAANDDSAATKNKQQQQQPSNIISSNDNNQSNHSNQSANHKFWASLNQNAASSQRNRSSLYATGNLTNSRLEQTAASFTSLTIDDDLATNAQQAKDPSTFTAFKDNINQQHDNLGQDLIISHRNSSTSNASIALQLTQKQQQPEQQRAKQQHDNSNLDSPLDNNQIFPALTTLSATASAEALPPEDSPNHLSTSFAQLAPERGYLLLDLSDERREHHEALDRTELSDELREQHEALDRTDASDEHRKQHETSNRTTDMSNNSDLDDSSTHWRSQVSNEQLAAVSSNGAAAGGGNLIGVENPPTPPATNILTNNSEISHYSPALQTTIITDYPTHHYYCQQQQQQQQQKQSQNHVNNYNEPSISVDSESAVCKPPPSTTLQLPHWTEAIYELNNAILEATSVAGGAENGEFIYIVESGDIILELNQVKVSGFTLVEFKELLNSKPVHLLSAVQTIHSHGLSTDLKHYLSCSFPKNSVDKQLQDLIRENIYRRFIPCTTRPPKEGEVDKVDYHFLTKEHFIEMNNMGMLLECGMYGGHYYGTMKPFSDLNSLSIYSSIGHKEISEDMRQPLNANHPAIGLAARKEIATPSIVPINLGENPLYENQESLRLHQMQSAEYDPQLINSQEQNSLHNLQQYLDQHHQLNGFNQASLDHRNSLSLVDNRSLMSSVDLKQQQQQSLAQLQPNIVAVDSEALPHGWERVIDKTHGTYYIDHNTQRTQYERPYEIELTKRAMGFGFTLVETENGLLLVRSIIPGGPAHLDGTIRPGDILISAVGVSVANLQHTDVARLFSTFAIGDRVRLTFARSTYVVDTNLVPDEYLFSNGTNGDLAVAVNPNYLNHHSMMQQPMVPAKPFNNQCLPEPTYGTSYHNNYYANNEEIALQRVQYGTYDAGVSMAVNDPLSSQTTLQLEPQYGQTNLQQQQLETQDELDKYEYHQVDLDRDSRESNWGIRLIGGSEVDRAISIGSIVFGGAASKNGKLKSGDEIISINGYNVVGATHQHVVDLISSCSNRASLVVRRRKFAEACEVVLTRNMDEGFGFVIISSHNCALIGSVIKGSPADRCQQLHVKDRIIAVNGNYITSDMQHPEIVNLIKECGSTLRLRIIPADCYTVELIKSSQQDNFGFSMRGGSEYDGTPLYILRVAPKGLACDLLNVGDQIIEINNIPTVGMTHQQAATIIKYSDPIVKLKLRRNYVIPPSLLVASPKELSRFNQVTAEMKTTFSMDM